MTGHILLANMSFCRWSRRDRVKNAEPLSVPVSLRIFVQDVLFALPLLFGRRWPPLDVLECCPFQTQVPVFQKRVDLTFHKVLGSLSNALSSQQAKCVGTPAQL